VAKRWATVLSAVCLLATVVAMAYAAGKTKAPAVAVMRAQRFELVDDEGKVWATLGFEKPAGAAKARPTSRQVSLRLLDRSGAVRARLGLSQEGGVPELELQTGRAGARLDLREGGEPKLSLRDANGRTGVALLSSVIGSVLLLPDQDGEALVGLGTFRDGSSDVILRSATTKASAGLSLSAGGVPGLELHDKDGQPCGRLGPPTQ
jgi:hypothetical protein